MTRVTRTFHRQLRLALSGLCLLSLLACVGTGWLWWRGYRVTDSLLWIRPDAAAGGRPVVSSRYLMAVAGRGGVTLGYDTLRREGPAAVPHLPPSFSWYSAGPGVPL